MATPSSENYDELKKDYDAALKLKQEGNTFFKSKDYQNALKSYTQIFIHIGMNPMADVQAVLGALSNDTNTKQSVSDDVKQIKLKIDELRLSAFNNMSMVYLKQNNYKKAIEHSTKAIKCSHYNFKARLRRARSYRHLKEIKKAKNDLEFLQKYGYKYDLQIINELKLLEIKDFESDDIVIDEEEEKKKAEEEKAKEKKEREEKEAKEKKETAKRKSNDNYIYYVIVAVFVLILAVIVGVYFQFYSS